MQLKVSSDVSFPLDVVTQTLAAIGRKGAGKTYLATMLAEQMLDAGAQVIILDPVGNWWGLRVGADGKSKGKDIFIIGGEHGDVPLVPEAGAKIAKLLVEKGVSAVIDVSGFRIGEHKRFAAEFGEEFFHLKKSSRSPVHLFVEEAQKLIPQRVGPDEARMVGAFEQIVRLGRNYGIGCTLITQRPQSVNKEVLSQVECLCVLQVTGPHERKALEEWVQEVGADRTLVGELPGLARGEGYIWSPSWLRLYKRVHFATKTTFDTSATPELGKATKAAKLSTVDVEALREHMAEVVKQAERDDPKALRKRIAELERVSAPTAATNPRAVEQAVQQAVARRDREWKAEFAPIQRELEQYGAIFAKIKRMIPDTMPAVPTIHPGEYRKPVAAVQSPRQEMTGDDSLKNPEQRILNALAWLESVGNSEPEQTAVAFLAGYSYGGGAYNNPRGALNTKGLIEYRAGNRIALTDAGRELAVFPDTPLTTEELHAKVMVILQTPHKRILQPLLDAFPDSLSNEELAAVSGYAHGAGAFNNPKGRLRSLGLIEYLPGSRVRASNILFV